MAKNAGGLSQVPYALIAVRCLVLLYSPLVPNYAPMLLGRLGFQLHNFTTPLIGIVVACNLLIIPLCRVAASRLRHAGWSPWLALPLLVPGLLKVFVTGMAYNGVPSWFVPSVMVWATQAFWTASLVIGLGLILVPGRKARAAVAPAE